MGYATLTIDQRGSRLDWVAPGVLRLSVGDSTSHRIGLNTLRRIVVHGDVPLSSTLLRAAQEAGVAVVLCAGRGPGTPVHLLSAPHGRLRLRQAQHRCLGDPACCLAVARNLVMAKLAQQQRWLTLHGREDRLARFIPAARTAGHLPALMGVEGAAAARYFAEWRELWPAPWSFTGRTRRPPRDPVNAVLSLGYTMALGLTGQFAALHGLDPEFGFLHVPESGRPSLGLDLLEPLRPVVDQWVWSLLTSGEMTPDRFTISPTEGCRLDPAGRAIFYAHWSRTGDAQCAPTLRHTMATLLLTWRSHGHLSHTPPRREEGAV